MNKGAILSLLGAGLITGSYLEFQMNQSDGTAGSQVVPTIERMDVTPEIPTEPGEAAEPSSPLVEELVPPPPPPPTSEDRELGEAPTFTPYTVAPSITNRMEVVRAMQEAYPPLLRDAGIGGTVRLYIFIEANGEVANIQIDESSGHPAFDDAALRVGNVYRFSPALNRDERVPVWVSFPITFQVR